MQIKVDLILSESHHQKEETKKRKEKKKGNKFCSEPYGLWLYLVIIKVMEDV